MAPEALRTAPRAARIPRYRDAARVYNRRVAASAHPSRDRRRGSLRGVRCQPPPPAGGVLLRRYGDRHTLAEVADELGSTETAASTLVRRALRELRRSLIGVPTT